MLTSVVALLKKDFLLEWRQRYAINGILLYVLGTVFICYLSIGIKNSKLSPFTWNALLWIVLLFASVNAVAKSFLQEKRGRMLYYYTIASPQAIILSKIIYNSGLLMLLSSLAYLFYSIVMGNPVQDGALFFLNVLLGAIGFSTTFTMISAIASRADNSSTLMTILGFPVIIPMLLFLMKISKNAIDGLTPSVSYDALLILCALDVMMVALAYILFPYLWKS
ncbi:MAG TPA: heme exporter protein CcmB [Cytophagaceae bacterium]|nr:heme exporter protein CcmB [Cytophagaceae bacterium]